MGSRISEGLCEAQMPPDREMSKLPEASPANPAVIIVSATASLQAALRPLFERFAAGRAGTSR